MPWTHESWGKNSIEIINQYIPPTDKNVLDYGCGSGEISKYLFHKGHNVTSSDISSVLTDELKKQNLGFKVVCAAHPNEIKGNDFNCVVCWCVLHHINPEQRESFLQDFSQKLKKEGKIIIAGFDESDLKFNKISQKNGQNGVAYATQNRIWPINDIADSILLSKLNLKLEASKLFSYFEPIFGKERKIRCFLLKKIV